MGLVIDSVWPDMAEYFLLQGIDALVSWSRGAETESLGCMSRPSSSHGDLLWTDSGLWRGVVAFEGFVAVD